MFDPKSSMTVGHHLFLLPPQEVRESLQEVITSLAGQFGGISFEPHITLLARIEHPDEEYLAARAMELARSFHPFTVALGTMGKEDAYFRALYLTVGKNDALQHLHSLAATSFNIIDTAPYRPHLSLYYGNASEETKQEMSKTITLPERIEFPIESLFLYRTSGEAHQWLRIGEYELG